MLSAQRSFRNRPALPAFTLRLLLCLSLLVSSVGSTTAGAHALAALPPVAGVDEWVDGNDQADSGDCGHAADAIDAAVDAAPHGGSEDCLQRCLDLWLQQSTALFVAVASIGNAATGQPPFDMPVIRWAPRHTAPPMRPPIV